MARSRWPHHRHAAGAACPPRSFLADTAEHRQWQTPGADAQILRASVRSPRETLVVCLVKWCRLLIPGTTSCSLACPSCSVAPLVWLVRGTRFGKIVVSVMNDREISIAVGINVNRIYTLAFTLGALCAALGGAAVAPSVAVAPGFAVEVGVQSLRRDRHRWHGEPGGRGPGGPPRWPRQSPGHPRVPRN